MKAVWDAHCARRPTPHAFSDFVDFSLMAEAVVTDAHAAAEFAELPVEHYLMLGADGGEAAAAEIQAVFRGNIVRKALRQTNRKPRPRSRQFFGDARAVCAYSCTFTCSFA